VDQQAHRPTGAASAISWLTCLTEVDRLRTGLKLDLERYLHYYNTERAHTGRWTKGRTPEAVLGKAKLWHKKR
jgi:hypothetical protein